MSSAEPALSTTSVESAARYLSGRHVTVEYEAQAIPALSELLSLRQWLGDARIAAGRSDPATAVAAEWLLDNDYHVQRAILQVREDMPFDFYRRLPALGGSADEEGLPRVFALAHGLLHVSHLQLSLSICIRFIHAYQERTPLTIAELWAFPTMLRLACLEILTASFARLFPEVGIPFRLTICAQTSASFDDTECVSRALANLAVISGIQWRDFFDQTSRVEEVLQRDPAQVYALMDFETRDSYRHAVEKLAYHSGKAQWAIAEAALAECQKESDDRRRSHLGYWLIGEGAAAFEKAVGYRPGYRDALSHWLLRHAGSIYGASLCIAAATGLIVPILYLYVVEATTLSWVLGSALSAMPASVLSVTLVNWLATLLVPPRTLPKLDFKGAIPADCRTVVVVPVLLSKPDEALDLVRQLEGHRLSNPDPTLRFVLLSDHVDAPAETMPGDDAVRQALVDGVTSLNTRYGRKPEDGPFHLMHRPRQFNAGEQCWMGWERKRGKLEQFNDFLLTGDKTPFTTVAGSVHELPGTRFVITADADTRLPPGSVSRMVGAMAHPLNTACFDGKTGRVRSGYTVIQPRIEIAPEESSRTPFARLYGGDTAIDIYSRAVSDVYQDIFGTGIYAGKGIYEVLPFAKSLEGRVPINSLVSHDLFEGLHGRAGLASDIVIYESFPSAYFSYARRGHRWIRGDWQLLPWLCRRVPGRDGRWFQNRLSLLDRWRIFDNLRRSLVPISLVALVLAGWFLLCGSPWVWTVLAILAPGAYLFTDLVIGLARGRRRGVVSSVLGRLRDHLGRQALAVTFLANDAAIAADAIGRSLWRLVSGRRLLEWTTAAHTAARFGTMARRQLALREMWASPALAFTVAIGLAVLNPAALASAVPLVVLWLFAPEIAVRVSRPSSSAPEEIDIDGRAFLRRVARRTWLFFETFAKPEDNWLPPDNVQEVPHGEIAHRTSPTNIGMMFLSAVSAWKLGFIGLNEMTSRLSDALDSLDRLERHRGHLLNWYDTRDLSSLEPRYVSTVDSGNLAVSLIAIKEACGEAILGPALGSELWDGLCDDLHLLSDALDLGKGDLKCECRDKLTSIEQIVRDGQNKPATWDTLLQQLCDDHYPQLEESVRRAIEGNVLVSTEDLREVQVWLERTRHHLTSMRRDFQAFFPWRSLVEQPPAGCEAWSHLIRECLSSKSDIHETETQVEKARKILFGLCAADPGSAARQWADRLDQSLVLTADASRALRDRLRGIAARAFASAHGMDFRMLFDESARLFHIGYNVSTGHIDQHHYDLLATEARLASFFAISKGDVSPEHWLFLGRPITKKASGLSLVSWNGSMFEYLMPTLFLRSDPSTLLGQSDRTAVDMQRDYGRANGIPWGISESGFASQDHEQRYRYRAFGIPGLGLRRGLSRDLVVAPYATILALSVRPGAALSNLKELAKRGLVGRYGFYEAADFTPERVPAGAEFAIVRSYMSHHHGMSLAALGNALCSDIFVKWFHADPHTRTIDLLLNERVPWELPPELGRDEAFEAPSQSKAAVPGLYPWEPWRFGEHRQVHAISNGRLTSRIMTTGGSGLWWRQCALTRFPGGFGPNARTPLLYVQDREDGRLWSVRGNERGTPDDKDVVFHQHQMEFRCREDGIAVTVAIGIPPGDDVELRRITVVNETDRTRRIALTGYAEVVLGSERDHGRHPAFSKLFVGSEYLGELNGLIFMRRPRDASERPPVMLHRIVTDDPTISPAGFETDRLAFLGRYGDVLNPDSLGRVGLAGRAGWTLDPIMALQVSLELEPHGVREFAFATIVAGTRESALELAERYTTLSSVDWAFSDAETGAAQEAHKLSLEPGRLPELQLLLSTLLLPRPAFRAPPGVLMANRRGQSDLWALGISGDHPILTLKVGDGQKSELFRTLVSAHHLWRRRGIFVDLVVLHTGVSGYVEPVRERLMKVLSDLGGLELLGRNGGIHLVVADQAGVGRAMLVEAAAHVILDEAGEPLLRQLSPLSSAPAESPRFEPTNPFDQIDEDVLAPSRSRDMLFDNGIGGFTAGGTEYLIQLEPGGATPAPWANVLANESFGTIVTEAGLGWTWAINSGENRLTPWSNDPVVDPQTEALYLRDERNGRIWTSTPQPAGDHSACTIRHGAGYTVWERSSEGLNQELLVFVAEGEPVKVVRLRVRNLLPQRRRITATYYAEWLLGVTAGQLNPFLTAEYDASVQALMASNPWNTEFSERVAFLTSTLPPHSVTTSRSDFLGRHGDARRPDALLRWDLGGRLESTTDCCAAFQVHLDIGVGEVGEVTFVLGQGNDLSHARELAKRWRDRSRIEGAFDTRKQVWNDRLGAVQVKTPDTAFNTLVNRWLLYQTLSSRVLARAGFYQAGGAVGFRDQLQDVLALLYADRDRARRHILAAAARQFEEGDVLHWWHPPLDRGVRTRCSDDLLWLPYVTSAYVAATGDETILSETAPFLHGEPLSKDEKDRYARFETTGSLGSIFEHCRRALERGFNLGADGLPLIGSGDWNDAMDRVGEHGRGQSVWLGWFLIAVIDGFVALCERLGRDDLVGSWRTRSSDLLRAIEESGWDGKWYLRAMDDDGRPWGAESNDECKIDSISQSWAVLSGAGDPEKSRLGLSAAANHLMRDDDQLVRLLWPAFDTTPREPGYIKAYPPGIRENGGQYSHAAAWLGIAFAQIGDGDRAKEIFDRISPITHASSFETASRYRIEPYVVAGDIAGYPPHVGRGGWSWYTGAAAWSWRLAVEYILGLRMIGGDLQISPCLPRHWMGFEAQITRPNGALAISVEYSDGIEAGESVISVNGQKTGGSRVTFPTDGTTDRVHIQLSSQRHTLP